ncbi:MAG TPA: LysM peptidoglycan-binding domain-containing protein [Chitinophagaceae bacterium]|nr:LysM peptidoglycan-binding domain-containing protein [Chitinophagaceae bacterium]
MKKMQKILMAACLLTATYTLNAQSPDDYIVHTVKKGEILSVLAKKYGTTPGAIAKLNNFGATHVLHVGDKVKLPANAVNREVPDSVLNQQPADVAKQGGGNNEQSGVQPSFITHIVQKGEYYSVLSKKYHVTVDEILSINNFRGNHVLHAGDKIKLPAGAAAYEQEAAANEPVKEQETPAVEHNNGATTHIVQKKETLYSISKKYSVTVAEIKEWNNLKSDNIDDGQKLLIRKPAAGNETTTLQQPQEQPQQQRAAVPPVVTSSPAEKLDNEAKTAIQQQPQQQPAVKEDNIPATGYFSSLFGRDVSGRTLQTANGMAMTFKTASGWNDKKYYILMNDAPPGSVVQVTNEDGKAIYAKVLWNMGDEKDNDGLNFRLSDAAAAALGLKASKFQLAVTFYQ